MESEDEYDRSYRQKHNRNKFRGERQADGSYSNRCREHRRSRDWQHSERPASHHYSARSADREDYGLRRGKRQRELEDEPFECRKKGPRSPHESPKRVKLAEDPVMEDPLPGAQNFVRPGPHMNSSFFGSTMTSNFPAPKRFSAPPFQFHPMHQWPAGPSRPENSNRLLNFKAYMASQEDDITDEEAQRKYSSYKENFLRLQVQEFFMEHQTEEWFRQRYHPVELAKVQLEKTEAVKERLAIFMLYQQVIGIDELVLECTESMKLTKFLDNIVVLLEGGNVEDIVTPVVKIETTLDACDKSNVDEKKTTSPEKGNTSKSNDSNQDLLKMLILKAIGKPVGDKGSTIELEANSEPGEEVIVNDDKTTGDLCPEVFGPVDDADASDDIYIVAEIPKDSDEISDYSGSSDDERRLDDFVVQELDKAAKALAEEPLKHKQIEAVSVPESKPPAIPTAKPKSDLLNLNSIFIRALPPTFTKQEVEAMCAQHEGFVRLALADPTAERNWLRRAWATYEAGVNLSSVVYRMNILKPRNCTLGVMVNRKLSNRIRYGAPLSTHSRSIRTDMRLAAQLVYCLDRKHGLWSDSHTDGDGELEQSWMLGILKSKNPLLDNVMNVFTEESSSEEDELLGSNVDTDTTENISESSLRDLTRFMDRLLIYLRVVHSVDFYQRCEYVNEHHMPNRCGIMHVRGVTEAVPPTPIEVENYCKETVNVITKVFLDPPPEVSLAEQQMLGVKKKEVEIEKLINAVTKNISEEKLQCEICSKKFRSTLFIRKHIETKHSEKLDEVVMSVEFFNNYLRDAKRPKPWDPLSPSNEKSMRREALPLYNPMMASQRFNARCNFRQGGHGFGPYGPYPMPGMLRGGRHPNYRYPMPGAGALDHYGRPIVTYRDLDAPNVDDEVFI